MPALFWEASGRGLQRKATVNSRQTIAATTELTFARSAKILGGREEASRGPTGRGAREGDALDFVPIALAAANRIERAQAQPAQGFMLDPAHRMHR